ncbi:MAG: hypothetical protein JW742_05465 [Candidatus Aminicenantes bacterium]|nr:hypothetical protein [Candidatus Aminicenantes bacterium]
MRKIRTVLLALLLVYAVWLVVVVLRHPYPKETADRDPLELQGVYHLHTKYSDGLASAESVARSARRAGLDFIILTDHGNPNYDSFDFQGWKDGVLALSGSELSVHRGHLVALGFRRPAAAFSRYAETAVLEVGALGGFTIIAHPYSKTRWSWGEPVGYQGIELINGDSVLRKDVLPSLPYLPALLFRPRLTMIKMLDDPAAEMRKWDALSRDAEVYGYFSADAHVLHRLLFSFVRLHVLLDAPLARDFEAAASSVWGALRSGRFYNAVTAAAPAAGFRFWGEQDGRVVPMGGSADPALPLTLRVRAPWSFGQTTTLIRNGETLLVSKDTALRLDVRAPGVYRVEVTLPERTGLRRRVPWVVSNPIFLRKD